MSIFSQIFGSEKNAALKDVIERGAFLVDVRTPAEFSRNPVKGSINIPLDKIPAQLANFKDKKEIVVFCLSGGRSSQAKSILEKSGFTNVVNGGSRDYVNQFVK